MWKFGKLPGVSMVSALALAISIMPAASAQKEFSFSASANDRLAKKLNIPIYFTVPSSTWADLPKLLELAKRPNAVVKVSGACTLAREPYPFPDIWDPLARVFDAWGFERCLWGTDWTRAFAVVNYERAVAPFRQTNRLSDSERAMLMGGACAKAYRWSPKKD